MVFWKNTKGYTEEETSHFSKHIVFHTCKPWLARAIL